MPQYLAGKSEAKDGVKPLPWPETRLPSSLKGFLLYSVGQSYPYQPICVIKNITFHRQAGVNAVGNLLSGFIPAVSGIGKADFRIGAKGKKLFLALMTIF
jgi:hypothetical protein